MSIGRTLTRRSLLGSAPAFAVAVATPAVVLASENISFAAEGDDSTLFGFLAGYREAQADLAKVNSELEWIAAEWKHLWPLAPEELLGMPFAHRYVAPHCGAKAERDIAGNFMMRDVTTLRARLSKKRRAEGGTECFGVATSDSVAEDLARWRANVPKGRTAKSLAKNQKFRLERIRLLERNHALALAYEAETARLRQVSGADAAAERFDHFTAASYALSEAVMRQPANTLEGLAAKAELLVSLPRAQELFDIKGGWGEGKHAAVLGAGWFLSHDINRLRGKAVLS